jgi:hypothetical protein
LDHVAKVAAFIVVGVCVTEWVKHIGYLFREGLGDVEAVAGASSPRSMSTTSPMASPQLETAQAGWDKFVSEAASWARS